MLRIHELDLQLGGVTLFSQFGLSIADGEVLTLMGPSGSGKSSLLAWMVGDAVPNMQATGELWLNDRRVDSLATEKRRVGILFQDDLLFAHLSVGQNLAFALPAHVQGRAQRQERTERALADMGMEGFHDRDPATLSGGQRARVSVMRALLAEPEALLLDEPFSKLDASLRNQFRAQVFGHIQRTGVPTLLVTHDEADVPEHGRVVRLSGPASPFDKPGHQRV